MAAPRGNKYAVGNEGGRPSKLTPEVIEKATGYIATCVDSYDEKGRLTVRVPSLAGLARYLNVSRETITNWRNENKEFLGITTAVLAEQEQRLINKGLSGEYNPTIAKLMMGKHGYSDKQELMGENGGPVKIAGVEIKVRK